MVEYAQPNTHHSFHIGHFRNTILGEALARLVQFAGFDTIRASYPGDIGLGVITILWAYKKFYKGQEPAGRSRARPMAAEDLRRGHRLARTQGRRDARTESPARSL